MGLLDRLRKNKNAHPDERRRRLLSSGRITDGRIVDVKVDAEGRELVVFVYSLNGVDFESADELTAEQRRSPEKYYPGSKVGIRFDPKNQYDSIVE